MSINYKNRWLARVFCAVCQQNTSALMYDENHDEHICLDCLEKELLAREKAWDADHKLTETEWHEKHGTHKD